MKIIPAIDIINGKCVRLVQGNFSNKTVYDKDPVDYAKALEDQGFKHLHLVDLDGAKKGTPVNLKIVEQICHQTRLRIDFGGGVKDTETARQVFNTGISQITAGSIAVRDPEMVVKWLRIFGPSRILLGADVKEEKIYIDGWKTDTGIDLFSFLQQYLESGIQTVICTDISRDGLLQGSAVDLYRKILLQFPQVKLIASGGVNSQSDLQRLEKTGLAGAIVGKALLENKIKFN